MHELQCEMQLTHVFVLPIYFPAGQTAEVWQRLRGSFKLLPEGQTQAKFESSTNVDAHAEH